MKLNATDQLPVYADDFELLGENTKVLLDTSWSRSKHRKNEVC
jgi:hypothetical protein